MKYKIEIVIDADNEELATGQMEYVADIICDVIEFNSIDIEHVADENHRDSAEKYSRGWEGK